MGWGEAVCAAGRGQLLERRIYTTKARGGSPLLACSACASDILAFAMRDPIPAWGKTASAERLLLAAIFLGAFAARVVALWATRPEFTGWFNHTYYYWVQTRGLLEQGTLPYSDLPLTFHLYAVFARLLNVFGLEVGASIINASRLVMCLVPALLILPVYFGLRRILRSLPFEPWAWSLVALAAFLPLTFVHMPELLQKNLLGLLALASFMVALYARRTVVSAIALAAIALTHFGTLAVAVLFLFAWIAAVIIEGRNVRQAAVLTTIGMGVAGAAALILNLLDKDAAVRLAAFARSSIEESLLGLLFGPNDWRTVLLALLGIVGPAAVALALLRVWSRHRAALAATDRVFWLANIGFAWALVAPVLSLDAVPRLVLFTPLPLLFVLAYQLRHGTARRLHRLLLAMAAAGCSLMLIGETVSLVVRNRDQAGIHAELRDLRERFRLNDDDLIVTEYGVNALSNWYLGTRASLVTSVRREDFASEGRVFVLIPATGHPADAGTVRAENGEVRFLTPTERYWAMRQRVRLPSTLPAVGDYSHLSFYLLDAPPANWIFDDAGRWIGWRTDGG